MIAALAPQYADALMARQTVAPQALAPSAPASPSERVVAGPATAPQQSLLPPRLFIELDEASERFVQTVIDPSSETVLRRFPNEGQLAFSRGVNAYVRALRAAEGAQ